MGSISAPLIGGIVAGAGSIGGSLISSGAAGSAASTQAGAANAATSAELQMFDTTQANLAPWIQAGGSAENALMGLLGFTTSPSTTTTTPGTKGGGVGDANYYGPYAPYVNTGKPATTTTTPGTTSFNIANSPLLAPFTAQQFQSSPGYQFQLQQGLGAINNAATATGVTGNTLQSLMQYGTGLANQDWYNAMNAYYTQQNNVFNKLSSVAGGGAQAALGQGQISAGVGANIGSNIIGAGNALAAGQVGSANALSSGLSGAGNSIASNYLLSSLINNNNNNAGINLGGGSNNPNLMGGTGQYATSAIIPLSPKGSVSNFGSISSGVFVV